MRKITALCLALLLVLSANAQKRLSARSAVVLERAENVLRTDTLLSAYITVNPSTLNHEALRRLGVKYTIVAGRTATARIPLSALAAVAEVEGVEYLQTSTPARQMLDVARSETGATLVSAGTGLPQPFTGKGVIVGIVDSGFDYGHAAFRGSDGALRIKRVWEQATTAGNGLSAPEPFGYGTEFATAEEILAAGGDIKNNSHGTHVASIAAGSPSHLGGALHGMAPDADIVLVSMTEAGTNNVNISNAIAYIFNYAEECGLPCVVNLSLGAQSGPHDGTSTFDIVADELQGPGRLIIGAAGNHTVNNFHIHRNVSAADCGTPLRTFLDYQNLLSAKNDGDDVELWTSPDADVALALVLYKLSDGSEVARAEVPGAELSPAELSLGRNVSGTIITSAEVSPLNGRGHVVVHSDISNIRSGYAIAIEMTPLTPCQLDLRSDNSFIGFSSRNMQGFIAPTADDATICEIGGTAKRILSVGAYATRVDYNIYGNPTPQHLNETLGDICSFSNYGPTDDGRVKPNIAAPGAFISAAVSQYDNSGTIVLSQYFTDNDQPTSYGFMQGTSMATPVVTGIVASWLEACPTLTPEELAEIVSKTARTDTFTGEIAATGSNAWGYGKIDALAGVRECLQLTGVYDIGEVPDFSVVRIYTTAGTLVGNSLAALDALPHGTYIVSYSNGQSRKVLR